MRLLLLLLLFVVAVSSTISSALLVGLSVVATIGEFVRGGEATMYYTASSNNEENGELQRPTKIGK